MGYGRRTFIDRAELDQRLGLLRCVIHGHLRQAMARIADATPALAVPRLDEDAVELLLGLVALQRVRM